jgi:hypothetical protein
VKEPTNRALPISVNITERGTISEKARPDFPPSYRSETDTINWSKRFKDQIETDLSGNIVGLKLPEIRKGLEHEVGHAIDASSGRLELDYGKKGSEIESLISETSAYRRGARARHQRGKPYSKEDLEEIIGSLQYFGKQLGLSKGVTDATIMETFAKGAPEAMNPKPFYWNKFDETKPEGRGNPYEGEARNPTALGGLPPGPPEGQMSRGEFARAGGTPEVSDADANHFRMQRGDFSRGRGAEMTRGQFERAGGFDKFVGADGKIRDRIYDPQYGMEELRPYEQREKIRKMYEDLNAQTFRTSRGDFSDLPPPDPPPGPKMRRSEFEKAGGEDRGYEGRAFYNGETYPMDPLPIEGEAQNLRDLVEGRGIKSRHPIDQWLTAIGGSDYPLHYTTSNLKMQFEMNGWSGVREWLRNEADLSDPWGGGSAADRGYHRDLLEMLRNIPKEEGS